MMTLSEALYNTACDMSEGWNSEFSCNAVHGTYGPLAEIRYAWVMQNAPDGKRGQRFCSANVVERDALRLGWEPREFRVFMLLMASEALRGVRLDD